MDNRIVRRGIVSEVNPAKHTARVTFEDNDDVVSAELGVLTSSASKNNLYRLPDVGEQVICLFEQNDAQQGDGVILGSVYSEVNQPVVNSQDKYRLDFADGTFIEYDRQTHKLVINCVGEVEIKGSRIDLN